MDNSMPRVMALGFFDGVHLGHGALLRRAAETAKQRNVRSSAFTFDAHPGGVLNGETVSLLSTPEERAWLMKEYYAIEEMVTGSFRDMMMMPWQDFIREYLVKELGVVHVVAGHDFRFGWRGEGDPEKLKEECVRLGVGCDIIDRVELGGITVSSTYIRELVARGETERAMKFLGHPHTYSGTVVHGKELGRRIGFPTANLLPEEGILTPASGVYASRVLLADGRNYMAVTNVGIRPTVEDGDHITIEPWILDFDGDIYGRTIRVEFYRRLRGERKFDSLAELTAAVMKNGAETRAYFQTL